MKLRRLICGKWNIDGAICSLCLVMPYAAWKPGQYWLRWWLVAWWYQVITWTNVDLSPIISKAPYYSSEGITTDKSQNTNHERSIFSALEGSTSGCISWVVLGMSSGHRYVNSNLLLDGISFPVKSLKNPMTFTCKFLITRHKPNVWAVVISHIGPVIQISYN